jgi:hypothetical protein
LYAHPPLSDLARLIGYRTIPLEEAKRLVKELEGRHGRKAVAEAAKAIVHVDTAAQPPTVRLTDEAVRLCWQLLGPPAAGASSPGR